MKKREFFKIDGNKVNRVRKHCPKCGPGVFLAEHKNRSSCGRCGYTEFKGGARPPAKKQISVETPKVEVKPVEQVAPVDSTPNVEETAGMSSNSDHVAQESALEKSDKPEDDALGKESETSEEIGSKEISKGSEDKPEKKAEEEQK